MLTYKLYHTSKIHLILTFYHFITFCSLIEFQQVCINLYQNHRKIVEKNLVMLIFKHSKLIFRYACIIVKPLKQ